MNEEKEKENMSNLIEDVKGSRQRRISMDDSVVIDRAPADVFAYLVDVSNDPVWQEGVYEAEYTSEGPIEVGTTGVHRARPMGMTIEVGWQLTEFVEPNRVAWRFISGPFTGNESYTLEPTPSGTRLTHWAELEPHGLLRLLRPMISGMFVKQSEVAIQTLKQILESPVAATG